jgi:hypothetical protein
VAPVTLTHATLDENSGGGAAGGGEATPGDGAGSPEAMDGPAGTGQGTDTLSSSSGATVTVANSIIYPDRPSGCSGNIVDGGNDITTVAGGCPGTVGDPKLGPLADNGGPVLTQALGSGSAALDIVPTDGAGCLPADARGVARPQFAACDAGAYELAEPDPQTGTDDPPRDTTAPAFLSLSLKPARFTVKKGTTFSYGLSEAARVRFTVARRASGRRVRGKCVKPARSNRRKGRCARFPVAGRFAADAIDGANTKRFAGRIGGRPLKPGRYRATLVATDAAGNVSAPARVSFRVVRGRAR